MNVIKASGEVENFSIRKIYKTVREAGGSRKLAKAAMKEVKRIYFEGITTKKILLHLVNFLRIEPGVSERYDLKRGIMALGPSGFPFEDFFARVLEYHGYEAKASNMLKGKVIIHEVDVVAKKKKKWMVECKYHNETGTITRLQPAMYTYARFLDLSRQRFDKPWLVTNTKCSLDARRYAKGVGLKITSWNYPKGSSLLDMIEKKGIYPITILKSLPKDVRLKLYDLKVLVANDLLEKDMMWLIKNLELPEKRIHDVMHEIKVICKCEKGLKVKAKV
jgi:predicted RecB family endonuclease